MFQVVNSYSVPVIPGTWKGEKPVIQEPECVSSVAFEEHDKYKHELFFGIYMGILK